MVQFGVPTVEAAMKLGREAADYISGTFTKVVQNGKLMASLIHCHNTAGLFQFINLFLYKLSLSLNTLVN